MKPFKLLWKMAGGGIIGGGSVAMLGPDFQEQFGRAMFDLIQMIPGTDHFNEAAWIGFIGVIGAAVISGMISAAKSLASGEVKLRD